MACFTVPLAEAVVVTVSKKILLKKNSDDAADGAKATKKEAAREKIEMLEKMLYGGSFLLAIEHIYHGEVTFVPPFLTAMNTPEEIPVMLHEMATVGVGMALLVTAVWGIAVGVGAWLKKRRGNSDGMSKRLSGGVA